MSNTLCRWVSLKMSTPPTEYLLEHEKQIINEHLHECEHCRELQLIAVAMNGWNKLSPPDTSLFVQRKIITAALEGRMPGKTKENIFASIWTPWLATAGTAIAVLVTMLFIFWGNADLDNASTTIVAQTEPTTSVEELASSEEHAPKAYNLIHFEPAKPVRLTRKDKVWGTEDAIVNLEHLSKKLTRIELIQGKIVVKVTKRAPGERFEVVGPSGVVEVVGTVFSVEVDDMGIQKVRVLEGKVKVRERSSGLVKAIPHDQELTVGAEAVVEATSEALDSDRQLMTAPLRGNDMARTARRGKYKKHVSTATALASKAIDDKRLGEAERRIKEARHSSDAGDVPSLYARLARAYRQQKNYNAAKNTYKQLIREYPESVAGQNAIVSLAQLQLNALGNPGAALELFSNYLKSVPSGYLAEAAWVGKARSQKQLGKSNALAQTSSEYLSTYSNGAFAAEMMLYQGQIKAQSGKCGLAEKDYRKIIARWPNSSKAKQAQQGLAACGTNQ